MLPRSSWYSLLLPCNLLSYIVGSSGIGTREPPYLILGKGSSLYNSGGKTESSRL